LPLLLPELALYCCPCNPRREQGSGGTDKPGCETVVSVQDAPEPFQKLPATRASAARLSERQHQIGEEGKSEEEEKELSGRFLKLLDDETPRAYNPPHFAGHRCISASRAIVSLRYFH
jgi:hypothetical protein